MNIIDLMKELNYPTCEDGVCKGLALMAQRACWSGQFEQFQARMNYLGTLKPNQLHVLLDMAKQHDKDLRDNKTTIPLSQNEQILLTVDAFFFQIWAHFNPRETQKSLGLHQDGLFNQLETHKIEELMYDKDSEDKTIAPLPRPDRYLLQASNNEYQALRAFFDKVSTYGELSPGCVVSSANHDIHVFYNNEKKRWVLTNHDVILERESIDDIAAEIIYAFKKRKTSEDIVNIAISVYTDKKNEKANSLHQELTQITDDAFNTILTQSPDINRTDVYGNTLLHVAAMYGFTEKVTRLACRDDIHLNTINEGKFSALILAIMFGHTEVVQELLKHPINKAGAMYGHESALYFASLLSNVEIVDALLKKFGVPDTYLEELNPLGGAVVNNQHGVIQRLLQEPDIKKSRILPYALSKGSDNETINLLLANPEIGLNSLYMSKGALHIAAERGDIGLVSTLLARGKQITPINHENNLVWMPFEHIIKPIYQANTIYLSDSGEYKVFNIHGEVCTGTIDMASFDLSGLRPFNCSLLSDLGTDPEKALNGHVYLAKDGEYIMRDHNGMLHSGKIPDAFLSFLNMNELDVDINKPEFQFKVTFALTQVGHTQINTILKNPQLKSHLFSQLHSTGSLISFIDVNLEGPQRDKTINLAAQYGHLDIVRELLQYPEIDLNYRRGLSKPTLLTQIVRSKSPDAIRTLELLLNHPEIDVNLIDDMRSTPLCTAVQYGNVDAVRALLKHNKINVNQGNPLEIAIREGHYDILKLLINHPGINMVQPSSDGFLPLALAAHFATYNTRYDKYVRAMLSQQSVLSPTSIQQFNQLDTFWQNYYQAQPLIQCIQKNISLLNATHNGYTKLVISDKSPEEHEIDNNTVVLINDQNEWIIYRKNKDQMESLILDKSGLDIDMIRCVDNKQGHQIYKSHELIDYILLQCSHTYADVVECLQGELWDFISDCKHLEFDKEEITSQINGLCNRAMYRCDSDKNSKKPMFFNANQSTLNLKDSFSKAREECHNRIEQVHCSMQPASPMNSRMG